MKKVRKILGITVAIASVFIGNAAKANFNEVYKVIIDGVTKYYIPGTANTQLTYFALGTPKPQALILNSCGWGKVKNTATSEIVDIMSQDQQSELEISYNPNGAEQPAPTCTSNTNGTYTDSNAAKPLGSAFRTGTTIWIKAGTTAAAIPIETQALLKKTTKVNACGWATISPSASTPLEVFKVGANEYNMITNITSAPQICKKTTTGYATYTPANGF